MESRQHTSMVKVVGAFVDTLVLNVYPTDASFQQEARRVAPELQEELRHWKEAAQEAEEDIPTRFVFAGVPLLMTSKGEKGFQWILRSSKLALAVNRGSKMALLAQVRCSSEYLWSVRDLAKVIAQVHAFLISVFGEYIVLQPSACDLAVDVVGLDLGGVHEVKRQFVSRAQRTGQMPLSAEGLLDGPDAIQERWGRLTGLPFGARAGALSITLYDKLHEIKYKSREKQWFYDLWRTVTDEQGQRVWDGTAAVWRIEVRYRRGALGEMKQEGVFHGINDLYALEERLPGLWSYAVGHVGGGEDGLPDGWLRYVVPVEDTNRSRWPVHPDWDVIQGAFRPQVLPESAYEREQREHEELLEQVDRELEARPMQTGKRRRTGHVVSVSKGVGAPAASDTLVCDLRPYIRQRKRTVNMQRMVAQIAGCTITAQAWRPLEKRQQDEQVAPDLSTTFHFLYQAVEDYLEENERDFVALVHKKQALYSIETAA